MPIPTKTELRKGYTEKMETIHTQQKEESAAIHFSEKSIDLLMKDEITKEQKVAAITALINEVSNYPQIGIQVMRITLSRLSSPND